MDGHCGIPRKYRAIFSLALVLLINIFDLSGATFLLYKKRIENKVDVQIFYLSKVVEVGFKATLVLAMLGCITQTSRFTYPLLIYTWIEILHFTILLVLAMAKTQNEISALCLLYVVILCFTFYSVRAYHKKLLSGDNGIRPSQDVKGV